MVKSFKKGYQIEKPFPDLDLPKKLFKAKLKLTRI